MICVLSVQQSWTLFLSHVPPFRVHSSCSFIQQLLNASLSGSTSGSCTHWCARASTLWHYVISMLWNLQFPPHPKPNSAYQYCYTTGNVFVFWSEHHVVFDKSALHFTSANQPLYHQVYYRGMGANPAALHAPQHGRAAGFPVWELPGTEPHQGAAQTATGSQRTGRRHWTMLTHSLVFFYPFENP